MKNIIRCTICGKRARVFNKSINLFHCDKCNHTFTAVKVPEEKYLEEYFLEVHKNWFLHPNYKLFEFIRKTIFLDNYVKVMRVLDVGCGNGDLQKYFIAKGEKAELVGIDLAKNDKFPGIKFIRGNFFTYKIRKIFNVVTTLGTIEHIENPVLFVKKIHRLLNKNGLLVIMTIDSDSLLYWLARLANWLGVNEAYNQLFIGHHLQHFTKDSLRRLLENNGYEVIYQKNHNFPLKSVDVPKKGTLMEKIYLFLTALIFAVSSLLSRGMLQTVVCCKTARKS